MSIDDYNVKGPQAPMSSMAIATFVTLTAGFSLKLAKKKRS
jgi:hypothetical protein